MTVRFAPIEEPKPLSLSERLGVEGQCIYINKQHFAILAEDNPAELVTVWIAEKPRTAVIEVTEPEYSFGSRFREVWA